MLFLSNCYSTFNYPWVVFFTHAPSTGLLLALPFLRTQESKIINPLRDSNPHGKIQQKLPRPLVIPPLNLIITLRGAFFMTRVFSFLLSHSCLQRLTEETKVIRGLLEVPAECCIQCLQYVGMYFKCACVARLGQRIAVINIDKPYSVVVKYRGGKPAEKLCFGVIFQWGSFWALKNGFSLQKIAQN